jgi:hypothetical protein
MPSWKRLGEYLQTVKQREIILPFSEIENIIGRPLPKSADEPQFWATVTSTGGPQRQACRAAGFESFLIRGGSYKVRFVRVR